MKYLIAILLSCIVVVSIINGQSFSFDDPGQLGYLADSLCRNYRFDSASVYYCRAAKLFEQKQDWLNSAKNYRHTGNVLAKAAKHDSALYYIQKAFMVSEIHFRADNKEEMLEKTDILLSYGNVMQQKGNYEEGLDFYRKALKLVIETDSTAWLKMAGIWNRTGTAYGELGKIDSGLVFLNKALDIRIKLLGENHADVADSYSCIGKVYDYLGKYDEALSYNQHALKIRIAELGEMHPDAATSYNHIGIIYLKKGDYDKALEYTQHSLKTSIAAFGEMHSFVANCYNNIGMIYNEKGEPDRALEYFQKSLKIQLIVLGKMHPRVAKNYNNIGTIYGGLGEYDKALYYLLKSLKISSSVFGEVSSETASNYNNIGIIYDLKGDVEKALDYQQKAINIRIELYGEMHPEVAGGYFNIGILYYNRGVLDKALEYYQKSLNIDISTFGKHHPYIAGGYNNIGKIFQEQNDYHSALQYYQKALMSNQPGFNDTSAYVNPAPDHFLSNSELLTSLTGKANIFYQLYKNETGSFRDLLTSLSTYELAFELIQNMRNEYLIENTQLLLSENTKDNYIKATRAAIEYDKTDPLHTNSTKAFEFIEKGKSATLAAELNQRNFTGIPDLLTHAEKDLKNRINNLTTEIAKEKYNKEGYDTLKVNVLENESFSCSRKLDSLIISFETNYPAYYDLKYTNKIVAISEIKASLDHNTALLNYSVGDSTLFIATITDSLYEIQEIMIDRAFKQLITEYYKNLKTAETESLVENSQRIYKLLISPVEDYIAQKEHLIIIPDDYLYYLPFETLIATYNLEKDQKIDYSKLDYLIKDHSVTYNHSATVWYTMKNLANRSVKPEGNFIGFAPVFNKENDTGIILSSNIDAIDTTFQNLAYRSISTDMKRFNPLPYSKDEVTSILHLFEKQKKEAKAYLFSEANESNFKNNVGKYSFVHISSHGFSNDGEPKLSGIVFSQPADSLSMISNQNEDGILYAGETYALNLNADLVVLSSCESGLGKLVKGEGLQALSRGFLSAGSPNIIFSLWKALDEPTRDLMVDFYSYLLQGQSYTEALRQAKLNLINDPKTAFPHFWGGFVLTGR